MPRPITRCQACGDRGLMPFYEQLNLPVSSDILLPGRAEALSYPKAHIRLALCCHCGFIQNQLYDARSHEVSAGEVTNCAGADPLHEADLADELIERYNLRGKSVLEIGCSDGAFLELLCAKGGNLGTGIDPNAPIAPPAGLPIEYIRDFYGPQQLKRRADFICCRHTLEHVAAPGEFSKLLRRSVGNDREPVVFCEVEDVRRLLIDLAVWDFRYEHCSYFTAGSLSRLFRAAGFDVFDLRRGRDERSILIDAVVSSGVADPVWEIENDLAELPRLIAYFRDHSAGRLHHWSKVLKRVRNEGGRAVLWGATPRAISFQTSLDVQDDIEFVIDQRPSHQGRYLATTGHETAPPEFLRSYRPDLVIAMERTELPAIASELQRLGVQTELTAI